MNTCAIPLEVRLILCVVSPSPCLDILTFFVFGCIAFVFDRAAIASRSDCIRMVFGWSGGCIDEYSTGCVRIAWVIGSIDNTRTARRIGRALAVAWVDMDWEAVFTIDNCMSLCNHMYPTCIQCVSPSSNDTVRLKVFLFF